MLENAKLFFFFLILRLHPRVENNRFYRNINILLDSQKLKQNLIDLMDHKDRQLIIIMERKCVNCEYRDAAFSGRFNPFYSIFNFYKVNMTRVVLNTWPNECVVSRGQIQDNMFNEQDETVRTNMTVEMSLRDMSF